MIEPPLSNIHATTTLLSLSNIAYLCVYKALSVIDFPPLQLLVNLKKFALRYEEKLLKRFLKSKLFH